MSCDVTGWSALTFDGTGYPLGTYEQNIKVLLLYAAVLICEI